MESDEGSYCSEEDYDYQDQEESGFNCTNMDPALAKLMGVMIAEQTSNDKNVWVPPSRSGLSNSDKIINTDNPYFKEIKESITQHHHLNEKQLNYIKNTTTDEKMELIEIYNNIISNRQKK